MERSGFRRVVSSQVAVRVAFAFAFAVVSFAAGVAPARTVAAGSSGAASSFASVSAPNDGALVIGNQVRIAVRTGAGALRPSSCRRPTSPFTRRRPSLRLLLNAVVV